MRPRFLITPDQIAGDRVTLRGEQFVHAARSRRLRVGDTLFVFDGAGREWEARVERVGEDRLEAIVLGASPPRRVEPRLQLTLVQALPKGERMDWIVQKTTELGLARLVPAITERTVARPAAGRLARWRRLAREAAQQCGRTVVPEIRPPLSLAAAVELVADCDLQVPQASLRLFPHEEAGGASLKTVLGDDRRPRTAACFVGPEGGFSASEVRDLESAGGRRVHLGPRVLRTDTTAVVIVALVLHEFGELEASE